MTKEEFSRRHFQGLLDDMDDLEKAELFRRLPKHEQIAPDDEPLGCLIEWELDAVLRDDRVFILDENEHMTWDYLDSYLLEKLLNEELE